MPKTAGNSLLAVLGEHFGDAMKNDYLDYPMNVPPRERHRQAMENCLQVAAASAEYDAIRCIHGHFLPVKYLLLADARPTVFVAWMRDPIERLATIREEMQEARALKPISAQELAEMQDVLPSAAMTLATRAIGAQFGPGKRYRENHNTVISVHPGPSRPLYLCGARLVGYTSMGALMDNLGLNHTATVYDGKVTIAPVCDRRMMPDPAFYYECLRESFEELSSAAGDAVARARSKRRYAVARKRAESSTVANALSE